MVQKEGRRFRKKEDGLGKGRRRASSLDLQLPGVPITLVEGIQVFVPP